VLLVLAAGLGLLGESAERVVGQGGGLIVQVGRERWDATDRIPGGGLGLAEGVGLRGLELVIGGVEGGRGPRTKLIHFRRDIAPGVVFLLGLDEGAWAGQPASLFGRKAGGGGRVPGGCPVVVGEGLIEQGACGADPLVDLYIRRFIDDIGCRVGRVGGRGGDFIAADVVVAVVDLLRGLPIGIEGAAGILALAVRARARRACANEGIFPLAGQQ